MKYNGVELKEFTIDKPVVFDPPRKMMVWDDDFAATATFATFSEDEDSEVKGQLVRKWDDTEWHEPTVDYMFGEDAE